MRAAPAPSPAIPYRGESWIFPGRHGLILFCMLALCLVETIAGTGFTLEPELLKTVRKQYGEFAERRLLAWQDLIRNDDSDSEREKLEKVNTFFNRMNFVQDNVHYRKKDYWATPVEFLATNGGDCEDFSLAKYFTLKKLGIPEAKLNMTYVKSLSLNQAHMVVTYYSSPDAEPLVLDNLIPTIEPASKRTDLLPIYGFNGVGLWLAKARGQGKMVGNSDRLKKWQDLLQRLPDALK